MESFTRREETDLPANTDSGFHLQSLSMQKANLSGSSCRRALNILSAFALFLPASVIAQQYQETDLVSDTITEGTNPPDPDLKNPWGIARGTPGAWWVSDNVTGFSTLYDGAGVKQTLVVTIPHTSQTTVGSPTGIVFNGSSDFTIATDEPGVFIFASFDGTISGWNPAVNATNAIQTVAGSSDSILTGATIAQDGNNRYLYVADLKKGQISVYDTNFKPVDLGETAFASGHAGYAPFNIQNIGNNLYVTFAKQNKTKTFVDFGAGLGYVDVFSPAGKLLMRLEHGSFLNAPWGLTLAPSDFGSFSHNVIVGQFGSGEILAFDAVTGQFQGEFEDASNNVITISGLWALAFGAGVTASDPANEPDNALYFTAGVNEGADGLFGTLTPVAADLIQGNDQ
jgi:uncharacterized protein (TIGR03118 family)